MATTKSYVKITNEFGSLGRKYDRAVASAVDQAARIGAAVAHVEAEKRHKTGAMADIKVAAPRKGRKGWNSLIVSTPFYAAFQEFGTRGKRTRKVKKATIARRSSASGQERLARAGGLEGGVTPLRFMAKGRIAARKALLPLLQREIGRVR